jgi:hypothetical protein
MDRFDNNDIDCLTKGNVMIIKGLRKVVMKVMMEWLRNASSFAVRNIQIEIELRISICISDCEENVGWGWGGG